MQCPNCGTTLQRVSGEFLKDGNTQDAWVCSHCLNVYGEDGALMGYVCTFYPPKEE